VLIFGAHIGNWEASALAAQMYVPDVDMTFKTPRIGAIADKLVALRSSSGAGLISADASIALRVRDALKQGHMVGMLVDEYYADGIPVTMFNRRFPINPLFARFVRIFDCPFHGSYVSRMPDGRLRLNVTEAIEPAEHWSDVCLRQPAAGAGIGLRRLRGPARPGGGQAEGRPRPRRRRHPGPAD
jgi:KDO2-lipid IV(A) lauroyltransferase